MKRGVTTWPTRLASSKLRFGLLLLGALTACKAKDGGPGDSMTGGASSASGEGESGSPADAPTADPGAGAESKKFHAIASVSTKLAAFGLEFAGGDRMLEAADGTLYSAINNAIITPGPGDAATIVHAFSDTIGGTSDGRFATSLIQDKEGNFYGTTYEGGSFNHGTVFEIDAASGTEKVLYSFGGLPNDTQGLPTSLIQASDGNFYGTTAVGGPAGTSGQVFKMTREGVVTLLYQLDGKVDGAEPRALVEGSDGDLYGVTWIGGAEGAGTVFKVSPSGTASVLHAFSPNGGGKAPIVLIESSGQFYGIAEAGGADNSGTFFQLSPSGEYTVLHEFSRASHVYNPISLVLGSDGKFYGTATNDLHPGMPASVVFKITPGGSATIVYAASNGQYVSLLAAGDGKLYGTSLIPSSNGEATSEIFGLW